MVMIKPLKIGDLVARVPVIQGGMGVGVSLSSLAGAVAKEGGIGVISTAQIGYREPDFDTDPIGANLRAIQSEICKAREIAQGGVLGVNIMVATRKYEEYVKAAVSAGIDMIISGAGLPMDLPKIVGAAKTKLAPIVSSVKSAQVIMRYWWKKYSRLPDAVVIEGPLAGGHLGFHREQLDDIDDKLNITNEFYQLSCKALEDKVNQHFRFVKWSLFLPKLDGEKKPYCECYHAGVPYSRLNGAAKVNAGIDIARTIGQFYDVSVPVVLDECESVNHPLSTGGQQIRLVVSKDDKLKVEYFAMATMD